MRATRPTSFLDMVLRSLNMLDMIKAGEQRFNTNADMSLDAAEDMICFLYSRNPAIINANIIIICFITTRPLIFPHSPLLLSL